MNSKIKKVICGVLLLCIFFCLIACETESSTGINGLTILSLDDKEFFSGVTYKHFKVEVDHKLSYETSEVNVVVEDNSIIDIIYDKDKTMYIGEISYDIVCKSTGTTTFYFETSDKSVKSNEIEITVLQNVKSLKFDDASNITFYGSQSDEDRSFVIDSNERVDAPQNVLEFISENPGVATIELDEQSLFTNRCTIRKVGVGETYVYIQTKDGTIQSEKIMVVVGEDASKEETDSSADNSVTADSNIDNSRTVYVTPYGSKYHYSMSCAGDNARAITEDSAKNIYGPCKNCT